MLSLKPLNTPCNFGSNHLESLRFFVRFRLSHNISQPPRLHKLSTAQLHSANISRLVHSAPGLGSQSPLVRPSVPTVQSASRRLTNEVTTPTLRRYVVFVVFVVWEPRVVLKSFTNLVIPTYPEICQDMPSIPVHRMTLRFKIAAFHHCR